MIAGRSDYDFSPLQLAIELTVITLGMSLILLDYPSIAAQNVPLTGAKKDLLILAQVTPDATLPVNSQVTRQGKTWQIDNGTLRGNNLFHSFDRFSVPTNNTAFFNNNAHVRNIFTRITGKELSNIDGILRANGTANLFFLNPNGILFGKNARLNLGGSFVGTTARSIGFEDGTRFSTQNTSNILTVSLPISLELAANSANITVIGNGEGIRKSSDLIDTQEALRVSTDATLALVGGNISIAGGALKTAGGRIELGSVLSGRVSLIPNSQGWSFGYDKTSSLGDIGLYYRAGVDASGNGGGYIQFKARRIKLVGGSQIEISNLGEVKPGILSIEADDSIQIDGIAEDGAISGIWTASYPGSNGDSANIEIETGKLIITRGGIVTSGALGFGAPGNINVSAKELVEIIGASRANVSSISATSYSEGNKPGGNVNLKTRRLVIKEGGAISSAAFGSRDGGIVSIDASSIEVIGISSGNGVLNGRPSRLSARSFGGGNAGDLFINANDLTVKDGGQVTVRSDGTGNAGILSVYAQRISLSDGGSIIASTSSGNSGEIAIASNNLQLKDASITASAGNRGRGGNIAIATDTLVLDNSSIVADAFLGAGGNVKLDTSIVLQRNSDISASSELGINGTVTLDALTSPPQKTDAPKAQILDVRRVLTNGCTLPPPRINAAENAGVIPLTSLEFLDPQDDEDANVMLEDREGNVALLYLAPCN